ncbi:MAG: CotH kinase family protein [Cytophagaceae bacterium]
MRKYLHVFYTFCVIFFAKEISGQAFTSSNLPIVVINTGGQNIDNAFQNLIVWMGVIDNGPGVRNYLSDPFNNYSGDIEIKLHGSSTIWLPKKSYSINTLDPSHDKMDVPLFGLPAESDWTFKALYQDKSFLRDELAFRLFIQMGHYSSRTKFFELVVDGNYRGVYQVEERIKRNVSRVNIAKLKITDLSGDQVTGGYIIKLDKREVDDSGWFSNYYSNLTHDSANFFAYHYPKPDSIPPAQKTYIRNFFNKFESVLASSYFSNQDSGYSKYLDVPSFIDFFIINEISRNVDGYRASTYFFKDRDSHGDGKLRSGPIWDYNIAWGNASYNGGNNPAGWQYQQFASVNFIPFWWWQFMSDPAFTDQLKCRYQSLRTGILDINTLNQYIDSMALFLNESQNRNFAQWPIMGQAVYPNPTPVPTDYSGEITSLKNWIQQRLTWMDNNLPGICQSNSVQQTSVTSDILQVFPNPFSDDIELVYRVYGNSKVKVELLNLLGERIAFMYEGDKAQGIYQERLSTQNLAAGTYLLKLSVNERIFFRKLQKTNE